MFVITSRALGFLKTALRIILHCPLSYNAATGTDRLLKNSMASEKQTLKRKLIKAYSLYLLNFCQLSANGLIILRVMYASWGKNVEFFTQAAICLISQTSHHNASPIGLSFSTFNLRTLLLTYLTAGMQGNCKALELCCGELWEQRVGRSRNCFPGMYGFIFYLRKARDVHLILRGIKLELLDYNSP